ncbi:glioma pathogenesis-related protein 1, partial [Biomphalaria pfeifferi]
MAKLPINLLSKRHIKREHDAGLTSEEISVLLNLHNNLRATVGSSDMTRMRWNFGLAKTAQAYAEECKFEYTSFEFRKNLSDLGYVGENLYIGTGRLNVTLAATMWWEEIQFYDYDTAHCQTNHKCGHYTQMAWADSYALGCGFNYCHTLRNVSSNDFESGNNLVCHYAPGGNYRYAKPFKKGPACSQCPSTMKFCVDHLCAFTSKFGSASTSIHGYISQQFNVLLIIGSICINYFFVVKMSVVTGRTTLQVDTASMKSNQQLMLCFCCLILSVSADFFHL